MRGQEDLLHVEPAHGPVPEGPREERLDEAPGAGVKDEVVREQAARLVRVRLAATLDRKSVV